MLDWLAGYWSSLGDRPVQPATRPGGAIAALPEHPPQSPEDWDAIFADLDRVIAPNLTHWQHPGFFGYFPANASTPAVLADLLCAGLAVQGMLWSTSPACTELETRMLDWLAELIDLPDSFTTRSETGGGVIQGTASEAALVAMVAARARTPQLQQQSSPSAPLVAYCSSQAHSSITKAAIISGVGRDSLRLIEVDPDLRMFPGALASAIARDRAAGCIPFFICATVGTTAAGAFDPLEPIGAIAQRENLWLHVDAAWAGSACVCPEHRSMLAGVERADSFNFNPHKWLLTNFDCSALWARDTRAIVNVLSITPEYLRNRASESGAVVDYRDWQIPLGRRFRALKLWFVLRRFGAKGLQAHIREHIRLAAMFESWVREDERFDLAIPRSLALVCFRLASDDDAGTRSRPLLERVNATGEVFLTHAALPVFDSAGERVEGLERFVIRLAIGGAITREAHVKRAWEIIKAIALDPSDSH